MNRLFILCLSIILSSCLGNELDIKYSKNNNLNNTIDLKGTWKGNLHCSSCCNYDYHFDVVITDYNTNTGDVKGEVKISLVSDVWSNSYAKYHAIGNFSENTLTLETEEPYAEVEGSCYFCDNNTYSLKLSEAQDTFIGEWLSSSNCDESITSSSEITIQKI